MKPRGGAEPSPALGADMASVGGWTAASRVLGFLRDIALAASLGAGPVAEAFVVAFSLPNLFRRLFAEGALVTAFVPMLARKLAAGGEAAAFAGITLSAVAALTLALTLLALAAMPVLILALAGGFAAQPEKLALATDMGRVMIGYVLLITLAAVHAGVLNATGRFSAAAAAPILLNLVLLAALGLAALTGTGAGAVLPWAVLVAGGAQLGLLVRAVARSGFVLRPRWPRLTPDLRRLARAALPAALAAGVAQVNLVVGQQVASHHAGGVAWLYYADRLYQLPLGVLGVALGVVLLPDLARRFQAGDAAGGRAALNRAAAFALLLGLPAALALVLIADSLVVPLFQRGAFGAADAAATAAALAIYGAGLPAVLLQKLLAPAFLARGDTRAPVRAALAGVAANLALALGLAPLAGHLAAPIAASVAAFVTLILLGVAAGRAGISLAPDPGLARALPRIIAACLGMGLVLHLIDRATDPGAGALLLLLGAGGGAYGLGLVLTGAVSRAGLRAALRRDR